MARMLITGGAGFIGSHLAEALLLRAHEVVVVDDLSTGKWENIAHLTTHQGFRFVAETITNEAAVKTLVRDCDVVFHLAAAVGVKLTVREPVRTFLANVTGAQSVLGASRQYDKPVVVASSSEIYGKGGQIPFREDDDTVLGSLAKSRWSYAISKVAVESLAFGYHQQMGLPVIIVRLFNTVGPRQSGQYGMVLPRFVQQALREESLTVYGDGKQARCFCDVDDVVRAIIELAHYPAAAGEAFNVGSTDEVTILDLARWVLTLTREHARSGWEIASPGDNRARAASLEQAITFVPYEQAYGAAFEDVRRRVPDVSKIRLAIGWEPRVPLEETIKRVVGDQAS